MGCAKLTPEQAAGLNAAYTQLTRNSEKVSLQSYDSTPEMLSSLQFQNLCIQKTNRGTSTPPELKTYRIVELNVTNYNCRAEKDYTGTRDKGNATAYFFWDSAQEKVICIIQGPDPCKEVPVKPGVKDELCPFAGFKCSPDDFAISASSVHLKLTNSMTFTPTNIIATVGSYVERAAYGTPDAQRSSTFHRYCKENSTATFTDGIITIDIANCDLPVLSNRVYAPVTISYTNVKGATESVAATLEQQTI